MKTRANLTLVFMLAVGFLVGAWFSPDGLRHGGARGATGGAVAISSPGDGSAQAKPAWTGAKGLPSLVALMEGPDSTPQDAVAYVNSLAPEEFPAVMNRVLNQIDSLPPGNKAADRPYKMLYLVAGRWAEVDPQASLAWSQKALHESPLRATMTAQAFGTLAARDPDAALHQAMTDLTSGHDRGSAVLAVADQIAEKDPVKALALVKTVRQASGDDLSEVYGRLAEKDPELAMRELLQISDDDVRTDLGDSIAVTMAEKDPQAALTWLARLPEDDKDDNKLDNTRNQVFQAWAKKDPQAAAAWAGNLPPSPEKNSAMSGIVSALAQTDPKAATAYVDAQPDGPQKNDLYESLITELSGSDIHEAVALLDRLDPGRLKSQTLREISRDWIRQDPQGIIDYGQKLPQADRTAFLSDTIKTMFDENPAFAADWIKKLPAGETRLNIIAQVASFWASADTTGAAAYAVSLPPGNEQNIMVGCVGPVISKDPVKGLAWLSQFPDGDERNNATDTILGNWAETDPASAVRYVDSMPAGPARDDALSSVADAWLGHDPTGVAQWAMSLPDGPAKVDVFNSIGRIWGSDDPVKTTAWLTQLPQGPARDGAAKGFSDEYAYADPATADQWAESISDPKARQDQVTSILHIWMKADPAAATAALQKSSLPDDAKKELLPAANTASNENQP